MANQTDYATTPSGYTTGYTTGYTAAPGSTGPTTTTNNEDLYLASLISLGAATIALAVSLVISLGLIVFLTIKLIDKSKISLEPARENVPDNKDSEEKPVQYENFTLSVKAPKNVSVHSKNETHQSLEEKVSNSSTKWESHSLVEDEEISKELVDNVIYQSIENTKT